MNAAFAHRLLAAPTHVWTAYQQENPAWGQELANCLRMGTVSPIGATKNLRKLTDCLADIDVQPLLCKWLTNMVMPWSFSSQADNTQKMQAGLAKCVRTIQLQAIAQGSNTNILPKMEHLFELTGNPVGPDNLWEHWVLQPQDIYATNAGIDAYFAHGRLLGDKHATSLVLSQYQQYMAQAMTEHPDIFKRYPDCIDLERNIEVASGTTKMAHTLLWNLDALEEPLQYALAMSWLRDGSAWTTREADQERFPDKTAHWRALATHAEMYLTLVNVNPTTFDDTWRALRSCPPLVTTNMSMPSIDSRVFEDTPDVVQ